MLEKWQLVPCWKSHQSLGTNILFSVCSDGASQEHWASNLKKSDLRVLCINNDEIKDCALSIMAQRQAMIRTTLTPMQEHETYNTLIQLDNYFGRKIKSVTPSFTLFGPYDGQENVLFSDTAITLDGLSFYKAKQGEKLATNYSEIVRTVQMCAKTSSGETPNGGERFEVNVMLSLIVAVFAIYKF